MTSRPLPLTISVWPRAAGLPLNARIQYAWLNITVSAGPGASSSGVKVRPSAGLHAEQRQSSVGDHQRFDLLGLPAAGDRHRRVVPQPDVLKHLAFVAIGEVGGWRLVHRAWRDSRGHMPDADQPLGICERQRLEQHAVDNAENQRVRADRGSQGDGGRQRKNRTGDEASKCVPH